MSPNANTKTRVAVIGADDDNMELIEALPGARELSLERVLEKSDMQPPHGRIDFDDLYRRCCETLDEAPDAVMGDLDFPVTALVSLLNRRFGTPGATPEAVAGCEHKYLMRKIQARVEPDETPTVAALNPFAPEEAAKAAPKFPFWLKPVNAHSSVLGFMIEDEGDLDEALHASRRRLHLFGEPFTQWLAHIDLPDAADGVNGDYMVAESLVAEPHQLTFEGYVKGGETTLYAAVESKRTGKHKSTFSRFQYPAELPDAVFERAQEKAAAMMSAIGYDDAPFNIEYFWNPETGALRLLEINARISQSHARLFDMVDGVSHHKIALDLALGRKPDMAFGKGDEALAAKFLLRSFEGDGLVKRVPSHSDIDALKRILPDIRANVLVHEGDRLSDLIFQESYSYELVDITLGGRDEEMLEDAYKRCVDSLPVHIKPLPEAA